MTKKYRDFNLLPNYFKKIAWAGIFIFINFFLLSKTGILTDYPSQLSPIMKLLLILSMLIMAISKNKQEDELTHKNKLKAFSGSFIYVVIYFIGSTILNLFKSNKTIDGFQVVLPMLFFYFILLFIMNRFHAK